MHQPEIYEKMDQPAREGIALALNKYGHLIRWREDNQDTVMDVGCGPGKVLIDVIRPLIEGKYSMLYGTDLSKKMIECCKNRYSEVKNLKFLVWDVMKESDFVMDCGPLDHAISSYVMHWVPDQGRGLRNIFNLLKPGGDFFTTHIHSSVVYNVLGYMETNAKWGHYFDNLSQFIPYSQTSPQPEADLRALMAKAGFVDILVDVVVQDQVMENYAALVLFFSGIIMQVDRVPADRRQEYVREFVDYGISKGLFKVLPSGEVSFYSKVFIAYGRKPESDKMSSG